MNPNEQVACEEYYEAASCPQDRCRWAGESEYTGRCQALNAPVVCFFEPESSCQQVSECKWNNGVCIDCPSGENCTHPPPPIQNCANYLTDENCPYDRCTWDIDEIGPTWSCSSGSCKNKTCENRYDDYECGQDSACQWNSDCGVCYPSNGNVPCEFCSEATSCGNANCTWQNANPDDPCGDDIGMCVGASGGDCKRFSGFGQDCCRSPCMYNDELMICSNGGNSIPCSSFGLNNAACSNHSGCVVSNGLCVNQGVTVACSDICKEFECSLGGSCHWDEDTTSCLDGAAAVPDCSTLSINDCYEWEQCAFLGNNLCVDGVCSDIMDPDVCQAWSGAPHNCVYHTDYGCYFKDEPLPCPLIYDQDQCGNTSGRCHYQDSCEYCLDAGESCPCTNYYEQSTCTAQQSCTWSDETGCTLSSSSINPPVLTNSSDHNPNNCNPSPQLTAVLDTATMDCRPTTDTWTPTDPTMLKCLDYYLQQASTTFSESCSCLYDWATHRNPENAYFMKIPC